jgi:hypothetical protein
MIHLQLQINPSGMHLFSVLLEKGVEITARVGCTLRDFLCGQLGLSNDYLDDRIQTLFLDARPVDDVDRAIVKDGSVLALSAAMPGLVGATMRKGGRYAAFRRDISQNTDECGICKRSGKVRIKMFNMVAREVGPRLFEAGVAVNGSDLKRIAERHPEKMQSSIAKATVDGNAVAPDAGLFSTWKDRRILLSITAEK